MEEIVFPKSKLNRGMSSDQLEISFSLGLEKVAVYKTKTILTHKDKDKNIIEDKDKNIIEKDKNKLIDKMMQEERNTYKSKINKVKSANDNNISLELKLMNNPEKDYDQKWI